MIEQALSSILSLTAPHLSEPFIPRMFQHKIFQFRAFILETNGNDQEA
jgi:hypothetical protein